MTAPNGVINIIALDAVVDRRGDPLTGSFVGVQGGGDFYERSWLIDLDADPVEQEPIEGDQSGAWDFPISLGADDTFVATLVAKTAAYDVQWHVDITYVDPHTGTQSVQRYPEVEDQFLETTAATAATHHWEWRSSADGSGSLDDSDWAEGPPAPE